MDPLPHWPNAERAAHYREQARKLRALATADPAGEMQEQLLALARQYDELVSASPPLPISNRIALTAMSGRLNRSLRHADAGSAHASQTRTDANRQAKIAPQKRSVIWAALESECERGCP